MAECVQHDGTPEQPRPSGEPETADGPRIWAYQRFPAARLARDRAGGPYRCCTLEASVSTSGYVHHDYYLPDEGEPPPGLADEMDRLAFVGALVQTDPCRRIHAFGVPLSWCHGPPALRLT